MYYVKISITQGKSFVNKVFIAIILRIFELLTKSKSSQRKKCKKKLQAKDINCIVHEEKSSGAKLESEL